MSYNLDKLQMLKQTNISTKLPTTEQCFCSKGIKQLLQIEWKNNEITISWVMMYGRR